MIGVEPVAPPGIMTEYDVGSDGTDPTAHFPLLADAVAQFAVGSPEERDITAPESGQRFALLVLAGRDE